MIAFTPTGPLLSFTSASSAPTSVVLTSVDGVRDQQMMLTNIDAANNCVVGWGASDAEAKLNAAAPSYTNKCYYLLHSTQIVITVPAGSYITGIAVASTAVIKVQAGYGN